MLKSDNITLILIGRYDMSELLDSLTKIENVASNISSSADSAKNEIGAKYKEMTLAFDSQLKNETQKKLDAIKDRFDAEMLDEQTKLHKSADDELINLNKFYESHHEIIVKRLVKAVLEVEDE